MSSTALQPSRHSSASTKRRTPSAPNRTRSASAGWRTGGALTEEHGRELFVTRGDRHPVDSDDEAMFRPSPWQREPAWAELRSAHSPGRAGRVPRDPPRGFDVFRSDDQERFDHGTNVRRQRSGCDIVMAAANLLHRVGASSDPESTPAAAPGGRTILARWPARTAWLSRTPSRAVCRSRSTSARRCCATIGRPPRARK